MPEFTPSRTDHILAIDGPSNTQYIYFSSAASLNDYRNSLKIDGSVILHVLAEVDNELLDACHGMRPYIMRRQNERFYDRTGGKMNFKRNRTNDEQRILNHMHQIYQSSPQQRETDLVKDPRSTSTSWGSVPSQPDKPPIGRMQILKPLLFMREPSLSVREPISSQRSIEEVYLQQDETVDSKLWEDEILANDSD